MSKEHILKTWADYWDAVASGEKTFEVRRDDRGFQKGDILVLRRMIKKFGSWKEDRDYSFNKLRDLRRKITYVLTGGQLGIEPGFVVLGLKKYDPFRRRHRRHTRSTRPDQTRGNVYLIVAGGAECVER